MSSAVAEDYIVSVDTTLGDGGTVTAQSVDFDYTGLSFDFSGGADTLSFFNPVDVNGTTFTVAVPSGKTACMPNGLTDSVATPTGNNHPGRLVRAGDGRLVLSNLVGEVSALNIVKGTTEFNGGSATIHAVRHGYGATGVFNNMTILSYGQYAMLAGGGTANFNNCAFRKYNQYDGNFVDINKGVWNQNGGSFGTGGGAYGIVAIGGYNQWSEDGANATYNLTGGGTFQVQVLLSLGGQTATGAGTGTFNLVNGTVTHDSGSHFIGNHAGATGVFNVIGGTYKMDWLGSTRQITVGYAGTGELNVRGGTVLLAGRNANHADLMIAREAGSCGTVSLTAGTIRLERTSARIRGGAGTSSLVINGGTLRTDAAMSVPTDPLTTFAVGPTGGVIQALADLTLTQPLTAADADMELGGVLKKTGQGTLTLSGANSYRVPTHIMAGSLALAEEATLSPYSELWVDSGVAVDLDGAVAQTVGGLAGQGVISNAVLATSGNIHPGGTNEVGVLTLANSSLSLGPGARLVVDVDQQGVCDRLVVTGTTPVDLSNLTIVVHGADPDAQRIGPILQIPAGVTGAPEVLGTQCMHLHPAGNGDYVLLSTRFMIIVR
ncbi:MAG: autotransporter-associated beta strand repeat-containing protein [Kiritimatiellia bacterium]